MILRLLCRAHFERYGSMENFEYMNILEEKAKQEDISPSRLFYKMIGYLDNEVLSAEERFELRKLHSMDKTEDLMKKLKISSRKEVTKVLKGLEAESTKGRVKTPTLDKVKEIAKILSEYFLNNDEKLLVAGKETFSTGDYLRKVALSGKDTVEEYLSNQNFLDIMARNMPVFVVKKVNPVISQGALFSPLKPSDNTMLEILELSLRHCLTRNLDMPETVYYFLLQNARGYQTSGSDVYLKLIDWSHALGMTIEEMFVKAGLQYVDRLEYFRLHKVFPYKSNTNNYIIFGEKSEKVKDFVKLNETQIIELVSKDALKTLDFNEEGPSVFLGKRTYLKDIFSGGPNDFSGAVV